MSGRIIKQKTNQNLLALNYEFPLDKDGAVYVRQSSLVQVRTNIHSFEMQTDKFVEHFRNMGCTGHIEVIADDEALSGTLAIHARPGMTRMIKLIESGKVGWIGAVAVNRFTRDKWLITPGVLMKTCHDHNVWIATLRMNFNFKDDYCQRVFMLEAVFAPRAAMGTTMDVGLSQDTLLTEQIP
jgi:DNA invertase Pin-like site-specific DNA recombinase